jgi:hypothetical protein
MKYRMSIATSGVISSIPSEGTTRLNGDNTEFQRGGVFGRGFIFYNQSGPTGTGKGILSSGEKLDLLCLVFSARLSGRA